MNIDRAKYEALMATIDDPEMIKNGEQLVKTAIEMSSSTALPFREVFYALLDATTHQMAARYTMPTISILGRIRLWWLNTKCTP